LKFGEEGEEMSEGRSRSSRRIGDKNLVSIDVVRVRLGATWLIGAGAIILIVVVQSLLGRFDDKTQEAWSWLLPTIMPTLGMIITVLGYTALDSAKGSTVVRKTFFQVSLSLSVFYLLLVLLAILIQPFTGREPLELMRISNLWLGPVQALVASALGVLFVSKQHRRAEGAAGEIQSDGRRI